MHLLRLDVRFAFYCRSTVIFKDGLNPIVLRIIYRGKRKDIFTGLRCSVCDWDNISQRVVGKEKHTIVTNREIDYMLHHCMELFEKFKYSGRPFTIVELVRTLKGKDEAPQTIIGYLEERVKELTARVDIATGTIQLYIRCIRYIQEFCQRRCNRDIPITLVDDRLLMEFSYFLRTDREISHNTSINYLKCLRTVLLPVIRKGIIATDPFLGLKMTPKPVARGFLTVQEIARIEKLTTLTNAVELAKDIFLFACYTGMAYIDVKLFSKNHVRKDTDGVTYIFKPRQKTGQLSIIPLLPPAIRLLQKYSDTDDVADFQWKVVSNQQLNEHLKTIQKEANIEQTLFFHLARHTFATTVTLGNGVPLDTVSRMLGHADIKMTERYAKISGYKIKEDMKKIAEIFP